MNIMNEQVGLRAIGLRWIVSVSAMSLAMPAFAQPLSESAEADAADVATQPAANPVGAPTAPETQANGADEGEVVIYGRRRAETAFQAPLSVTALSSEALQRQSISQITDLTRVAPNVIVRQSSSSRGDVQIMIRGQIIAFSNPSVDAPIGVYIDNAYVAQSNGMSGSLFDLSEVEINRGVQGTLSGRNNTGGAVRFYTSRPVLGELSAVFSGSLGTYNLHRESAIINIPIGDTLAIRIAAQDSYRGPLGRSLITGDETQSFNNQLGRISLRWEPSPELTLNLTYDHSRINSLAPNYHSPLGGVVANTVINCQQVSQNPTRECAPASVVSPPDIHDNSSSDPAGRDQVNVDFIRGTLDYEITPSLDFRVTAAFRDMQAFVTGADFDYSPAKQIYTTNFGTTSRQVTVEPQLTARLFDDSLTLIGGLFYFQDEGIQIATNRSGVLVNPTTAGFSYSRTDDRIENVSRAGYLHAEWRPTSAWSVAAGARYTRDKRSVVGNSFTDNTVPGGVNYQRWLAGQVPAQICSVTRLINGVSSSFNPSGPCPLINPEAEFGYWSYEATTRYELSDQLAVYARTGHGQKSGGITSPLRNFSTAGFEPEEVTDYEIGLKGSRLLDGSLSFNLSLYYSDYQNLQRFVSSVVATNVTVAQVFNVGAARIQGVEFDFNLRPVEGLTINGYVGYTDARYTRFQTVRSDGVIVDNSGNAFYQTPEWTSRLGFVYEHDLGQYGRVTLGGGWNYQSRTSLFIYEFPQSTQPGFSLFDARLTYAPSDRFELSIWGTNLADKQYFQAVGVGAVNGADPSFGFNSAGQVAGESRIVGATATMRF